jgi:hypothetical protein
MTTDFDFTPVVIIGAGRSGTNMLRDALTALDGFETWPCDEINPIWRHGNIGWPNDAIPPERASGPRAYIRRAFQRIWRETGKPRFVVEKTCANSLRVPFVDAVVPEAKYIHIVRDGVDVVASAQKRWKGEMELPSIPYYWAKIKYAPLIDLPRYGWSFIRNRIAMARSAEKRMDVWGPRFDGMDEMDASLDAVCATQWGRCVEAADAALSAMPDGKALTLRYEEVTADPAGALSRILAFIGEDREQEEVARAVGDVSVRSVGKGRKALGGDAEQLMDIMRPTLARFGYEG